MSQRPTIRVYVDGQNLFRRALKGSPYLWLDVARLCSAVLPRYEVSRVAYFTAEVRPAPHDLHAAARHRRYLQALGGHPLIDVHLGHFRRDVVRMPLHPWDITADGHPKTVLVKRTLEKGSDVNLATQLLWDAMHEKDDAYAVLTNDSDLVAPIRMLRDSGRAEVGVIFPTSNTARSLVAAGSWFRVLRESTLARCLLPERVIDVHGSVVQQPPEWKNQRPQNSLGP